MTTENNKHRWEDVYYLPNEDLWHILKAELDKRNIKLGFKVNDLKKIEEVLHDEYVEFEKHVLDKTQLHDNFTELLGRKPVSWNWFMPARLRLCRLIQVLSEDAVTG
jgi:hypothetical protein